MTYYAVERLIPFFSILNKLKTALFLFIMYPLYRFIYIRTCFSTARLLQKITDNEKVLCPRLDCGSTREKDVRKSIPNRANAKLVHRSLFGKELEYAQHLVTVAF